jgi:hypothetical protein
VATSSVGRILPGETRAGERFELFDRKLLDMHRTEWNRRADQLHPAIQVQFGELSMVENLDLPERPLRPGSPQRS